MDERLYLNGVLVDLAGQKITRQIRVSDIQNIGERKGSYSYTFKIPRTIKNKGLLDFLGDSGNQSRKPYQIVTADYIVESSYLVRNGNAIIRKSGKEYDVNIIDGAITISQLLADNKITDLDLSSLDHKLQTTVIIDSFSNTEGYIYALADYGKGVSDDVIKGERLAPCVFAHTLFSLIFEQSGIEIVGDFFTTNEVFLKELVTPSRGYTVENVPDSINPKGSANSDILNEVHSYPVPTPFDYKHTIIDVDLQAEFSIVSGDIVCNKSGVYRFEVFAGWVQQDTDLFFTPKVNGNGIIDFPLPTPGSSENLVFTSVLNINDVISFHATGDAGFISGTYRVDFVLQSNLTQVKEIVGGQLINAKDYLPETKQIDFVKDLLRRYGLMLQPVQETGKFEFRQLQNFLNDKQGAQDWTSKIIEIGDIDYKLSYSQSNLATYNYNEDLTTKDYDYSLDIDNLNLEQESTLFASILEIPKESDPINTVPTYLIPIWSESEENEETPIKAMNLGLENIAIEVRIFDETSGVNVSSNVPFLNLNNKSWEFQIENYYPSFRSLMSNYRNVSIDALLSPVDIENLDFFKLKYITFRGRYYYLTSVRYTPGKSSTIEALEIFEFEN